MQILNYELRDQPLQVILNTHFSKNVYLLNIDIFVFSPRLSIAIKQESINVWNISENCLQTITTCHVEAVRAQAKSK